MKSQGFKYVLCVKRKTFSKKNVKMNFFERKM